MGLKADELPLTISVVGEIGNNCFDHNLGHWKDVPGCWFETQITGGLLWVCIADRGQGVLKSLARTDPALRDDQAALIAAFERNISGRAPEHRGNGLKFVKNVILQRGQPRHCMSVRAGLVITASWDRSAGRSCFPGRPGPAEPSR